MDFFEAQDRARQRTKWLVLLFGLAVVGTVIGGYVSAMLAINHSGDFSRRRGNRYQYQAPQVKFT